jgi:hypothetical protein
LASKRAGRIDRKTKGSVENLVGWVKGSFFKQRRFLDRDDLEAPIARVAGRRQRGAVFARDGRAARDANGGRAGVLPPLKMAPAELAL